MQETSGNKLRVALYCRVSTEEQREGQTIDSQIRELEKFVAEKDWTTTGTYKDDGWSGAVLARPELDHLRDDASRGLFDIVLINDVDRLARDVTHLGVIKRDLERLGVRTVFRKLPGEQSPTQNLLVNILGSFAEFEKELIADRTRRGKRHKVEVRKQFLGSIPPYGFRYVSRSRSASGEGQLEILAKEAATVRAMYGWVADEGLSAQRVLRRLNDLKLPPRKGARKWAKSSVLRILRSEVYAGVWYFNKHQSSEPRKRSGSEKYRRSLRTSNRLRPRSDWLPVRLPDDLRTVDPALWRCVQEQLNRNVSFSRRNAKHTYLLAGLVKCGGCNGAYVGNPSHGRFSYRCSNRCKKYRTISEAYLGGTVWNAVAEALQNPSIFARAIKDIRSHRQATATKSNEDKTLSLQQIDSEEARVIEAYRMEFLSPEQLSRELAMLKSRREALKESASAPIPPDTDQQRAAVRRPLEEYCKLAAAKLKTVDEERKQQILRLMLTRVTFEGDRVRIAGAIPVDMKGRAGHIATTTSWDYGRNQPVSSVHADEINQSRALDSIEFELIRPI